MYLERKPAAASLLRKFRRTVLATAALSGAALGLAGCGNTYRPVVASINPVGPAGQPTKYAVAISSTGTATPGLVTLVDFSGDTVVNTSLIGVNPQYFQLANSGFEGYTLNGDGTLTSFSVTSSLLASQVLQSTLYPNSNPVSIYSQGTNLYIAESARNSVAELTGLPPAIQEELPTGAGTLYTVGASSSPRAYALVAGSGAGNGTAVPIETAANTTDAAIPVGVNPTYGVMTADSRRAFILNKGSNNVTVINAQTNALDTFCLPATTNSCTTVAITGYSISGNVVTFQTAAQALTAGQTVDLTGFPTSAFLNNVALTVSATGLSSTSFQATLNHAAVASTTESGSGTLISSTIPVGTAPLWADFAPTFNELLVLNAGSGTTPGSVTVISIPLCSQSTVTTNPNCDTSNPVDAVGFGQVLANIPVGINPVMIGVLQDGSQAFVANAGSTTTAGNPASCVLPPVGQIPNCSVSVINLTTNTVVATVPFIASTNEADSYGHGHPLYIGVTTGTPTGKAYIVAGDSTDITIIRTDIDAIQTHLPLQGNGVSVRMSSP